MREIKFRAWDKKAKKWINFTAIEFKRKRVFLKDGFGNYIDGDFEIVRFTGLSDKNGKEIYEGDIVRGLELIGEIFWEDEEPSFQFKSKDGSAFLNQDYMDNFEVIGNKFEAREFIREEFKKQFEPYKKLLERGKSGFDRDKKTL